MGLETGLQAESQTLCATYRKEQYWNEECVKHGSIARIFSDCFSDKFLKVVALCQCIKKKDLHDVLFLK